MKIVLDTNVFLSGVYFGGVPGRILEAWRDHQVELLLSVAILEEYRRASERLADRFPGTDINRLLVLLATSCRFVDPPPLQIRLCSDPDDDKFIACALAARCRFIVTGDRALLLRSGYRGLQILRPREFVAAFLEHE
jgi:putative PIN family toxin of toxin-antitoxin system